MNTDFRMNQNRWLLLTVLLGMFGVSCSAPEAPKVTFEDRPSSYSVSKYQGASTSSTREYLANSDEFIGANQSSLNRAIADLSAADQARAEERARLAASASSSTSSSGYSVSEKSSSRQTGNEAEMCRCTYDALKGEVRSGGQNTIRIRTKNYTWEIVYRFGNGSYLMDGSGNLEGRMISVVFENDRPTRVSCSSGTGSCRVLSSSRL